MMKAGDRVRSLHITFMGELGTIEKDVSADYYLPLGRTFIVAWDNGGIKSFSVGNLMLDDSERTPLQREVRSYIRRELSP